MFRYVGDMLAWLHQGIASEKESIHSLLKLAQSSSKLCIFITLVDIDKPGMIKIKYNNTSKSILTCSHSSLLYFSPVFHLNHFLTMLLNKLYLM